jgi:RNA polymerase sigma factor (sigma-70 family)
MSEKIEQLPILTNEEQYNSELQRFPHLTLDEQRVLESLAREGDKQARERIIMECMHFVEMMARRYSTTYVLADDYLDIVQVGNLALVEHIDRALSSEVPTSYLCGIARNLIRIYCVYRSRIIALPTNRAVPQDIPQTISLDRLLESGDETVMEVSALLTSLETDLEPEDEQPFGTLFAPLKEAMKTLTEKQREIITQYDGEHSFARLDLELFDKPESNIAKSRYYRALKKLREYFKQA